MLSSKQISCLKGFRWHKPSVHNVEVVRILNDILDLGLRRVRVDPMNGRGAHSDASDWSANQKLLFMVSNEHVLGAFKTPSLRNLLHTAPYGHDGRFPELADVLDFYSELPEESVLGHREETLQPLGLSQAERAALLAFLATLSGAPVGVDGAPLPVADEGED